MRAKKTRENRGTIAGQREKEERYSNRQSEGGENRQREMWRTRQGRATAGEQVWTYVAAVC